MAILSAAVAADSSDNAIRRVPRAVAYRYDALPLSYQSGLLVVALADPGDLEVLDALRRVTRLRIEAIPLARDTIRQRLRAVYGSDGAAPAAAGERRSTESPAVRAADAMFERAISGHASDIHVEPRPEGGVIRVRIDGVLCELETIGGELYLALVSRIKLLAGMDIADKRQPQDGRCSVTYGQREIDARVSSMPTIDGEKLVIRLLDHYAQRCELSALAMPPQIAVIYERLIRAPWGFVVVTGPTGSGKTTTLYASLAALDATTRNICSVEDPIEMRVRGVTQVGVNPRAGVTFATALRSFMRQDPNVIMVGEMRDAETAAVAISASLAGQFVFTTLHSNDAPRTVERLVELGVARGSLAAGLSAVLAQRLVRRLCENCRRLDSIPDEVRAQLKTEQPQWWVADGCGACADTGYSGRAGVYELMCVDDALRDAIGAGASSVALARLSAASGYRPMLADGRDKVLSGLTSFDELTRVVGWPGAR